MLHGYKTRGTLKNRRYSSLLHPPELLLPSLVYSSSTTLPRGDDGFNSTKKQLFIFACLRVSCMGAGLYKQAARLFAESCMDTQQIFRTIRRVPGLRVATSEHAFDVHFSLSDWCTLLRGRFWSHLDTISDDEMARGIPEVREVYGEDDAAGLTFPDRFTFIQVFRDHDGLQAETPPRKK